MAEFIHSMAQLLEKPFNGEQLRGANGEVMIDLLFCSS
jgi:hypothetical protein